MSFVLRHFDNADATTQSSVVHRSAKSPLVLLRVVNFNSFQVSRAIKPTDSVQLTVNNSQTDLERRQINLDVTRHRDPTNSVNKVLYPTAPGAHGDDRVPRIRVRVVTFCRRQFRGIVSSTNGIDPVVVNGTSEMFPSRRHWRYQSPFVLPRIVPLN